MLYIFIKQHTHTHTQTQRSRKIKEKQTLCVSWKKRLLRNSSQQSVPEKRGKERKEKTQGRIGK